MTRSFFQSFEEKGVAYLVTSGQATVLYGAAEFSEDLDIWVEPSEANIQKLIHALQKIGSRYYKLTPPLTEENMRKGHGFHFECDSPSFFLDVMGQPPRVGAFDAARDRSLLFESDWGVLPVTGVRDLVEIKKTQRLRDYDIITGLVLGEMERSEGQSPEEKVAWAVANIFSLSGLERLLREHPEIVKRVQISDPQMREGWERLAAGEDVSTAFEIRIQEKLQRNVASLQQQDREYWKPIVKDLKRLKAEGQLMPEGQPV